MPETRSVLNRFLGDTYARCGLIGTRLYPAAERPRNRFTAKVVEQGSAERCLLDLGCGKRATWLRSVAAEFGRCYGVDHEVDAGSEGNITMIQADVETTIPLPDASVDLIATRNVLEHFRKPDRAFRECRRVLRPGGCVYILTPNKWFPPLVAGRVLPHRARCWANHVLNNRPMDYTFPAYYRANSRGAFKTIARDTGFSVAHCEYLSEAPVYFVFSTVVYRTWALIDGVAFRHIPALRHYLLVVLRAEST